MPLSAHICRPAPEEETAILQNNMEHHTEYLQLYFTLGLPYEDILECLAKINRMVISMSTLKRQLRHFGLYQHKYHSDFMDVALFIVHNLQGSAQNHG